MQAIAAAPQAFPRPDRERLRALYHDEMRSLAEIGRMFGVSAALVQKWMRKDGTPTRSISEGTSIAQRGRPLSAKHREALCENIAKGRAGITPESRRKQAESMRGKTPWNKGKRLSPEHVAKLVALRADPEYRRIQSERFLGEKSPLWKGGSKPEHARRLDRAEWGRIRQIVYERDNWTCQDCECKCLNSADATRHTKRKIQAHHIVSRRDGGSDELSNLMTLCMSCHHKRERASK